MLLFYAVLLVSLAVLLFAGGLVASRAPGAPIWLTEGTGGTALTLFSLTLLVWGVLLLGQFSYRMADYTFTLEEGVLIASDLVISFFVWSRLRVRKRLAAYARSAPQVVAPMVEWPWQPERPITPKPSSPTKRVA